MTVVVYTTIASIEFVIDWAYFGSFDLHRKPCLR